MLISERIYNLLKEKNISQIDFSRKTGISQSTISDWRRKGTNPSADKIMVICETLDVTPYELLLGAESRNQKKNRNLYTRGKKIEFCHIDKALFLPRHIAYTISQIRCARA